VRYSLSKHCGLLTMRIADAIRTDHYAQLPYEPQKIFDIPYGKHCLSLISKQNTNTMHRESLDIG